MLRKLNNVFLSNTVVHGLYFRNLFYNYKPMYQTKHFDHELIFISVYIKFNLCIFFFSQKLKHKMWKINELYQNKSLIKYLKVRVYSKLRDKHRCEWIYTVKILITLNLKQCRNKNFFMSKKYKLKSLRIIKIKILR